MSRPSIWNEVHKKGRRIGIGFAKGINTYNDPLDLEVDELTDSLNMCSDDYPIIRTRNDRVLSTLPVVSGTIYGMGVRNNNELHVLSSNSWIYAVSTAAAWSTIANTIADSSNITRIPCFIEFNTQTKKYTIMGFSSNVLPSLWDGTSYTTHGDSNAPKSNLYTAHKNRLYGVSNDDRTLWYSAQGDPTDFTTVDDAGYIDITEVQGKITAITTFADHPIIWSANSMHELYGSNYSDYSLVNISYKVGCISRFSYVELNSKLFWLDKDGIYMYTGGAPRQVSNKANGLIEGINWEMRDLITAGAIDNKIYFNIPYGASTVNNMVIVVDLIEEKGRRQSTYTINREEGNFKSLIQAGKVLWGLRSDGYIYNIHSTVKTGYDNSTLISWSMETRPYTNEINIETAVRDIWITHSGSTVATMSLGYTTNDNSTTYTQAAASTDFRHEAYITKKQVLMSPVQLQGVNYVKFQLKGTGHKKISGMHMNIIGYGDVV